ncbi:MAG: DEAD/DEAH box helicase [Dehalococcoidales bacterium]|nr:DEAD/DEAH box helicase [Dehalococcoidales bacterium]
MSFETFNFHPSVMAGVRALGYVTPTPIQLQCIPPVMKGRDLIGIAQTGTGKTAAFALPILQHLLQGPRGKVRVLVISPTRELAEQTCEAFNDLGQQTRLRSVAVYGGVSMSQQLRQLRNGAEIVVACPGRLLDHLWGGSIDPSHIEILVIDEADRMFDMGFQPAIRSILQCLLKPHQTLLFSATMPEDIRRLVKDIQHDPVTVQIGHSVPAVTVSHTLYPVEQNRKTALLIELLRNTETESVLVFTRTKHGAERLARNLGETGFNVTSLQGNMAQNKRQAALDGFRTGSYKIMVATDIAARGIDVLRISHVINYDMPDSIDAYTHRIGRTGRVDQTGDAFSFVTSNDGDLVRDLERVLNVKLERRTVKGFNNAAPAVKREFSRSPRSTRWQPARSSQRRKAVMVNHRISSPQMASNPS